VRNDEQSFNLVDYPTCRPQSKWFIKRSELLKIREILARKIFFFFFFLFNRSFTRLLPYVDPQSASLQHSTVKLEAYLSSILHGAHENYRLANWVLNRILRIRF